MLDSLAKLSEWETYTVERVGALNDVERVADSDGAVLYDGVGPEGVRVGGVCDAVDTGVVEDVCIMLEAMVLFTKLDVCEWEGVISFVLEWVGVKEPHDRLIECCSEEWVTVRVGVLVSSHKGPPNPFLQTQVHLVYIPEALTMFEVVHGVKVRLHCVNWHA